MVYLYELFLQQFVHSYAPHIHFVLDGGPSMAAQSRNVDVPKRTGFAATRLGSWALLLLVACLVLASFAPIRMAFSQDDPQQKRTVPVPAKSVRTSNADATTAGNGEGWSAQTCAGTGDVVSYRLEATLPEDLEAFFVLQPVV